MPKLTELPVKASDFKLKFDLPGFTPIYTPTEILQIGAFGGAFCYKIGSERNIPPEVFIGVDKDLYQSKMDGTNNFFGVLVSPLAHGYMVPTYIKSQDPFGWFEWYCKFYNGIRRPEVDNVRATQWKDAVRKYWFYLNSSNYSGEPANRFLDLDFQREARQGLLQFGWDPTRAQQP